MAKDTLGNGLKMSAIVESLPHNIALVDEDGTVLAVNDAWLNLMSDMGLAESKSDVVGRHYDDVIEETVQPQSWPNSLSDTISSEPGDADRTFEYSHSTKSGDHDFKVTISPVDGEAHYTVTHEEITDCQQTKHRLKTRDFTLTSS